MRKCGSVEGGEGKKEQQRYFLSEAITYRVGKKGILIDEVLPIQYCDRNSLCGGSGKLGNKKQEKETRKY